MQRNDHLTNVPSDGHVFLLKIDHQERSILLRDGLVRLGHSEDEMHLWERLWIGDAVICMETRQVRESIACRVVKKWIERPRSIVPAINPFSVALEVHGVMPLRSLPAEFFLFNRAEWGADPVSFRALWLQHRQGADAVRNPVKPPVLNYKGYRVEFAQTRDDIKFISFCAENHAFGSHRAFLSLVAWRDSKRVAALLASLSRWSQRHHRGQVAAFGLDAGRYAANAVFISRILTDPEAGPVWSAQRALVECTLDLAPNVTDQTISMVEGVSYEYHPLAFPLGFQVVVPLFPHGSFYFWKPFSMPASVGGRRTLAPSDTRVAVKKLLKERRAMKHWLALGQPPIIEYGVEHNGWALVDSSENRATWNRVEASDKLFLMSKNDMRLRAVGTVVARARRSGGKYNEFPLALDLRDISSFAPPLDISTYARQAWFTDKIRGGMKEIPTPVAQELLELCGVETPAGRPMTVLPNPFLLHRTEFTVVPKQVFAVIPWKLREGVLPYVKEILEESGFSVKDAGDREGQVIFDDIWLLLNESEVVLVDFTTRRPNVYLEYGMALVVGKPIVAITQDPDDIPSDTPNLKYITYSDTMKGRNELKARLIPSIETTIADIQAMSRR